MRQFLPKPQASKEYVLSAVRATGWTPEDRGVLNEIAGKMDFGRAMTEGRLPSPFSRLYHFHTALQGHSGADSQARARAAFRGLCAVFAMRDSLGLDIQLLRTPPLRGTAARASTLGTLLDGHLDGTPPGFAPNGCFTYVALKRDKSIAVLAGLSPLTWLFPAAGTLPAKCAEALYWYDAKENQWLDPTADVATTDDYARPDTTRLTMARQLIHAWLRGVLDPAHVGGTLGAQMSAQDRQTILGEWQLWEAQLAALDHDQSGDVTSKALSVCAVTPPAAVPYPFLLVPTGLREDRNTDLIQRKGAYLVTKALLENRDVRLCGNVFGSAELAARWDDKETPVEGPNLGVALGREPWYCNLPFVFIDKLFTSKIYRLVDQPIQGDAPEEWFVLRDKPHDGNAAAGSRCWLYPFKPQVLKYFTAAEMRSQTKLTTWPNSLTFTLRLPGKSENDEHWHVTRHFHDGLDQIDLLDLGFDLRVFPNFDLSSVPERNLKRQLPRVEDRRYLARLRLSPDSEKLDWQPLVGREQPDDPLMPASAYDRFLSPWGDFTPQEHGSRTYLAVGKDFFWVYKDLQYPPGGLSVKDHGLLLLRLPALAGAGGLNPWKVGVDFGTSNSCVAILQGDKPQTLSLPIFTTSLLPTYFQITLDKSNEGASPMLDFPYWRTAGEKALYSDDYFPTQIATQRDPNDTAEIAQDRFDLRNGLIFFRNLSAMALDEPTTTSLFHDFPDATGTDANAGIAPRFHIKDRIKWEDESADQPNRKWRAVFHQHLRWTVLLAAIRRNAYVAQLTFSYPRAFGVDQLIGYKKNLRDVWGPEGDHLVIREPITESAAAARYIKVDHGVDQTVLDVGGGTTDITIFSDRSLDGETSLRFAADTLDDYVLASPRLRSAIWVAFSKTGSGKRLLNDANRKNTLEGLAKNFAASNAGSPEALRCIWYGLLSLLLEEGGRDGSGLQGLGMEMRLDGEIPSAVRGFFATTALMFGGLAYFAGLMDRQRGESRNHRCLSVVGNGGRYLYLLAPDQDSTEWETAMGELCETGSHSSNPVNCRGLEAHPKAAIALGLLHDSTILEDPGTLLYKTLDSTNFKQLDADGQTSPCNLYEFYERLRHGGESPPWEYDEKSPLADFLGHLDRLMPNGKLRGRATVVPGVKGTADWAQALLKEALVSGALARNINQRLVQNANDYRKNLESGQRDFSVEPLFITELIALLRYIRTTHAV